MTTLNSSTSPGLNPTLYWSGATGSNVTFGATGHSPRAIIFTGAGSLVLSKRDGSTLTLPESFAGIFLPLGDLTGLVASGSTAHTVLVMW